MSATIKVEVTYDVPIPPGTTPASPAVAEDTIGDPKTAKLSGAGSAGTGATTRAEETDQNGDTEIRESSNGLPASCQFTGARITVTVKCANGDPVTLDERGNVSVSGGVDGHCVFTEVVNTKVLDGRVIRLTTTKKRRCCPS
jgi:hypothetical protein